MFAAARPRPPHSLSFSTPYTRLVPRMLVAGAATMTFVLAQGFGAVADGMSALLHALSQIENYVPFRRGEVLLEVQRELEEEKTAPIAEGALSVCVLCWVVSLCSVLGAPLGSHSALACC